jgi:hypothetical protein
MPSTYPDRDNRIIYEVIVDCYSEEEEQMAESSPRAIRPTSRLCQSRHHRRKPASPQ